MHYAAIHVKFSFRNLSLNASTATLFLLINHFRENIWVRFKVQFHFLYIFEERIDGIHKNTHLTILSFYFLLISASITKTNQHRRILTQHHHIRAVELDFKKSNKSHQMPKQGSARVGF